MQSHHHEVHYVQRTAWLRAAVLGANDGIVSTASLLVGLGASQADHAAILLAGFAGLAAGAMSMAAGEFVSVSSQADLERADLATERTALREFPTEEHDELAQIYVQRGLDPALAAQVATQLMEHDALGAHARDELQIADDGTKPMTAALSSGLSFSAGAILPLAPALLVPRGWIVPAVILAATVGLALLGITSARAGGADPKRAVARVVLWGLAAMGVTGAVGLLFGAF